MVQDIVAGSGGSNPRDYTESGEKVFLVATTQELGAELWVGVISDVFPVSKVDLNGVLLANDIKLEWTSFHEQNTKLFEVQRSSDGSTFNSIAEVAAKGGVDTTVSYDYIDHEVQQYHSNILHYRLKILGNDGKSSYSNIISIEIKFDQTEVIAWPIPVQTQLELMFVLKQNENITLRLFDQQGRLMQQQQFELSKGVQNKSLSFTGLTSGIYFLSVRGKEINEVIKVVKE
jgi:hypothetical protein